MTLLCAHCVQFADVFKCNKNAKLWQTKLHKRIAMFWITGRLLGLHRVRNLVTNATLCTLLKQWEEDYPAEHVVKDVTIPDSSKRAKKDDVDKHIMMMHSKTANRWCRQTYIENKHADQTCAIMKCMTQMQPDLCTGGDTEGGRCKFSIAAPANRWVLEELEPPQWQTHNWAHFLLLVLNKVCHSTNRFVCSCTVKYKTVATWAYFHCT